jgi:hypothetical protein
VGCVSDECHRSQSQRGSAINSSGAPICGEIHLAISLIEPGLCVKLGLEALSQQTLLKKVNVQGGANKEYLGLVVEASPTCDEPTLSNL